MCCMMPKKPKNEESQMAIKPYGAIDENYLSSVDNQLTINDLF